MEKAHRLASRILAHPILLWWGAAVAIFVYLTDGVMVTYDALCHSMRLDQILSGAILPTKDESTVYIDSQRYSCGNTAVNSPVGY